MPRYDYRCVCCGGIREIVEPMFSDLAHYCETCQFLMHRVPSRPTVIFKGSGFYTTDSKSSKGGESSD